MALSGFWWEGEPGESTPGVFYAGVVLIGPPQAGPDGFTCYWLTVGAFPTAADPAADILASVVLAPPAPRIAPGWMLGRKPTNSRCAPNDFPRSGGYATPPRHWTETGRKPMFQSEGAGPDGRALVEAQLSIKGENELSIWGTACVPEGTLLYGASSERNLPVDWFYTTASAGGPERGAWQVALSVARLPSWIFIGAEDAEQGGLLPPATIVLEVRADGQVNLGGIDDLA